MNTLLRNTESTIAIQLNLRIISVITRSGHIHLEVGASSPGNTPFFVDMDTFLPHSLSLCTRVRCINHFNLLSSFVRLVDRFCVVAELRLRSFAVGTPW